MLYRKTVTLALKTGPGRMAVLHVAGDWWLSQLQGMKETGLLREVTRIEAWETYSTDDVSESWLWVKGEP